MVMAMPRYTAWVCWRSLSLLPCGFSATAQSQEPPIVPEAKNDLAEAQGTRAEQRLSGSISGTIVDPTRAPVAGARIRLSRKDQSPDQEVLSDDNGQFSFANVAPGPFQLTITSPGFAGQASVAILPPGENYAVPHITMALALAVTEVHVVPPRTEGPEDQIRAQEKQRGVGVVPNFYMS